MKPVFIITILSIAALVAALFSRRNLATDLERTRFRLRDAQVEIKNLRDETDAKQEELRICKEGLNESQAHVSTLSTEGAKTSVGLSELQQALAEQRTRTEAKRKEYEALLNTTDSAAADPRLKDLTGEITETRRQLKEIREALNSTQSEASRARETTRLDASAAESTQRARINDAQASLNALKAQRAAVNRKQRYPNPNELIHGFDQQISAAQTQLRELQVEESQRRNFEKSQGQELNAAIGRSVNDLKANEAVLQKRIDADLAQQDKLRSLSSAGRRYDAQKTDLIKRVSESLKEETEKLNELETKVRERKEH